MKNVAVPFSFQVKENSAQNPIVRSMYLHLFQSSQTCQQDKNALGINANKSR